MHPACLCSFRLGVPPLHPGRPADIGRATLQYLYAGHRTINKKKLDDLNDLLDYIPPVYHSFYQNLDQTSGDDSGKESKGEENEEEAIDDEASEVGGLEEDHSEDEDEDRSNEEDED